MADLTVLIRLHKHELDEKRRALAALYAQGAALAQEQAALEQAFQHEKAAVDAADGIPFTFASYVEKTRRQQDDLARQQGRLDAEIQVAKDSLMETFGEMKKYEMTQDERDRLEEEERRLREARTLDDIGLEGFRRAASEADQG